MRPTRLATAILLLGLCAPALAQDGNSTATVTTQTVGFTPATVTSAVNVRNKPDSKTSQVIATLQAGGTVMVRCSYGWCELADGGYVAQKFLSFEGGSFDVVAPPANGDTTAGEPTAPPDPTLTSSAPLEASVPDFSGTWTVLDAAGQAQRVLTLTQSGVAVDGILEAPSRIAKITGRIGGVRLDFSYQMMNEKSEPVDSGTGTLEIAEDGRSLKGRLMLNGLVLGDIDAIRQ